MALEAERHPPTYLQNNRVYRPGHQGISVEGSIGSLTTQPIQLGAWQRVQSAAVPTSTHALCSVAVIRTAPVALAR